MNALSPEDTKFVEHAIGYMELGMYAESLLEIERTSQPAQQEISIILLKGQIYNSAQNYSDSVAFLEAHRPIGESNPDFHVLLAFAKRRALSLEDAYEVLDQACGQFARNALIHYNLACYAAQLAREQKAYDHLSKAVTIDTDFKKIARQDKDFDPLKDRAEFKALTR